MQYNIFNEKIDSVKFMLSEGKETPDYEQIKHAILTNKKVTSKELYSILSLSFETKGMLSKSLGLSKTK